MLALAVSCETMYGPVQTPIASDEKKADGVEITVTEAKDESVIFTLAPKAESAYYSYMVHQANEAVEVDAQSLYSGAYKGKAGVVKTGSFKWTAETAVSTVAVNGLNPNTTYQIYAVAATPMGFVGQVANASFKTSDIVAPEFLDYEAEDNVVTLTFSEVVVRGAGALTAGVYAMNSAEIETGVAVGSVTVAEENIVVEGNTVTVTVANLPAGAFYGLNFPEGAFKDPSNNKAAALESAVAYGQDTEWEPDYNGVGGRNATQDWVFEDLPEGLTDWTAPIVLTPTSEYGLGYIYKEDLQATYQEGTSKTVAFILAYGTGYGLMGETLVAQLPEEPAKGATVAISVPAEAFEDYYLEFSQSCTPEQILFSPATVLACGKVPYTGLEEGRRMPLTHGLFDADAIILEHAAREVSLKSRTGKRSVTVSYPDMAYIGFWQWPGRNAPYVCIEPWTSLPGRDGIAEEISCRSDFIQLAPGKTYENIWTITVNQEVEA